MMFKHYVFVVKEVWSGNIDSIWSKEEWAKSSCEKANSSRLLQDDNSVYWEVEQQRVDPFFLYDLDEDV